jgi:hypothetical protein
MENANTGTNTMFVNPSVQTPGISLAASM